MIFQILGGNHSWQNLIKTQRMSKMIGYIKIESNIDSFCTNAAISRNQNCLKKKDNKKKTFIM